MSLLTELVPYLIAGYKDFAPMELTIQSTECGSGTPLRSSTLYAAFTSFASFTYEARPLPNDQSSRVLGERIT